MDDGLSPLGNLCVKKATVINTFLRKTLIHQKKMQKVFTSKDYFSKLLIRQRCRENKKEIKMKFKLKHKNGGEVTYRATDYCSFDQDLRSIKSEEICDYTFFVDGKSVSFEVAEKSVQDCLDAFIAKRISTKKQIWARKEGTQGNFKNNFHQIWVKK